MPKEASSRHVSLPGEVSSPLSAERSTARGTTSSERTQGQVRRWCGWQQGMVTLAPAASCEPEPSSQLRHTVTAPLAPLGSQRCSKLWKNRDQTLRSGFLLPAQPHHQTVSFLANDVDISEFSRY